jgi:hypothetical protein
MLDVARTRLAEIVGCALIQFTGREFVRLLNFVGRFPRADVSECVQPDLNIILHLILTTEPEAELTWRGKHALPGTPKNAVALVNYCKAERSFQLPSTLLLCAEPELSTLLAIRILDIKASYRASRRNTEDRVLSHLPCSDQFQSFKIMA